eukprot:81086_1
MNDIIDNLESTDENDDNKTVNATQNKRDQESNDDIDVQNDAINVEKDADSQGNKKDTNTSDEVIQELREQKIEQALNIVTNDAVLMLTDQKQTQTNTNSYRLQQNDEHHDEDNNSNSAVEEHIRSNSN